MRITEIATRRRVTIAMFTLAVVLFGFVSFFRLKVNLLPDLTYPTLTIRTEYPGTAPAEIENLISKPIEEALGVVKNVNRISSISRAGQSDVMLEFVWGTNMDYAGLDVREKLDVLELPYEIKRPSILRFDPSLDPIMRLGFTRSGTNDENQNEDILQSTLIEFVAEDETSSQEEEEKLKHMRRFAEEQIKKELEAALGVAAVKVSGGLEDEIQILVDQARMAQLNLTVGNLAALVRSENVNLSGGRLEEGTRQYLVRTMNQFTSVEEIGEVIVSHPEGKSIYLRDIATIRHGFKERQAITRLNGKEAVEIAIYKEGDANTVSVAREVEKRLRHVRQILPDGFHILTVYDQSTFITQSVNEVIQAGLIGGILAVIILYFFLRNVWATLIISISIPVSVIATFNLMYGADLTLNMMSLGGIALGIGMLLDNSIVVLENIARHREKGKDILKAAADGASEVSTAVTASTLTTVAVFFPLVFVKGIAGQLFRDQALTVTFALLASLVVALTLIPMLASLQDGNRSKVPLSRSRASKTMFSKIRHLLFIQIPTFFITWTVRGLKVISRFIHFLIHPFLKAFQIGYGWIENRYPISLQWALNHKRWVTGVAVCLFVSTSMLIPMLGIELIPQLSQGEFRIEFLLPPGTPLQKTDAVMARIQNATDGNRSIQTMFSVAGSGNRMDANPDQGGENWGQLDILLNPELQRNDEETVMTMMRQNLQNRPGLQYKISRPTLFTFRTPIEIEITGFDLDYLKRISNEIARRVASSPRFTDVKSTMETGHPEVRIHFDRDRAASLGLAVYQIADRVVDKIRGNVATRYSWHDRKIDVLLRSREEDRDSIEKIRRLIVNPESPHPVTLESIADIIVDTGPGEIRRIDQERVALVTANLKYGDLGSAAVEINDIIQHMNIPSQFNVQLAGQNKEMSMSFRSLRFALLLAVFLVYLVMASQFESFLHPFVILFTIPLAMVGAILGLWITGSSVSIVVFIGLILLAGIVVNNAIVLIDLINQLRAKGMEKREAIIEGARARLRPILMTTLTTILGLLPMALGFGEGAEVRSPMAITVIGGLTFSTLLTLILIPVVYSIFDKRKI